MFPRAVSESGIFDECESPINKSILGEGVRENRDRTFESKTHISRFNLSEEDVK